MVETGLQRWYIIIKKLKAGWQWTGGKKAYEDNEYQKAATLFAQRAESFPDWGMTHFWRLRAAIQTRDLKQAQLHLVKCREVLPQLEEVLNRWEILLKQLFKKNKKQITDELAQHDTYTDEQLQNKWEKPQWSWKSISIVIAILIITYLIGGAVIQAVVTGLWDLNLDYIIENIILLPLLGWWWNFRHKRVLYPEPFAIWFFTGARICMGICKHSRPFHIYVACNIIRTVLYILVDTAPGIYNAPIYHINYLIRIVLIAPLLEEIVFRETLFSFFREKWKRKPTYLLISVLFTLAHVNYITDGNLRGVIYVFVSSFIFSWFYEKGRHVFAPVLIHVVGNGSNILAERATWYLIYS